MAQFEQFSTDPFPRAAKVAFWNRLANETFVDLSVDPASRDAFRGELSRASVGALGLAIAKSSPAAVHRTPGHPGRRPQEEPVFFLHLQGRGRSICEQDGRQALLAPGDFAICDADRPYSLRFGEANEMFVAKIPSRLVRQRVARAETKVAVRMAGDGVRTGLLSSFMRGACSQPDGVGDLAWCDVVSHTVLELLELAYGDPPEDDGARGRLRRRACAMIEAELCDPALTPAAIAAALGVTPRYLQMAFADMRVTPSDYIRDHRLDLASRILAVDGSAPPITGLALEVGFGDLTYFSRAFRNRFGITPSAYRARRRDQAARMPLVSPSEPTTAS